jgi:DNA-binding response OmpR family regulator
VTQPPKAIRQTILVVEDDPAILKMVKLIFEEAGFGVLSAGSAHQARLITEGFPESIHMLLSDVVMPDVSGPELATALKQQRPEMRVLLMSGFADGAMLILNHGWHFIAKPFLASALLARVNDVLHSDVREQGTDHFDTRRQRRPGGSMAEKEFVRGEPVELAEGTYQGTRGIFLQLRPDIRWADIEETNGVIRSHPMQWLQHATGPDRPRQPSIE